MKDEDGIDEELKKREYEYHNNSKVQIMLLSNEHRDKWVAS